MVKIQKYSANFKKFIWKISSSLRKRAEGQHRSKFTRQERFHWKIAEAFHQNNATIHLKLEQLCLYELQ